MSKLLQIPRITNNDVFRDEYFMKERAVILEGGAKVMPAFEKWTYDYLIATVGDELPKVKRANGKFAQMPFQAFWKYLADPEKYEISGGPLYLTDYFVMPNYGFAHRKQLSDDAPFPLPLKDNFVEWRTIYAGPPSSCTPMHQDVYDTHTWLAQVRGEKTVRLCEPDDLNDAQANKFDAFSGVHSVRTYEAILQPGDILLMPKNWWHQVRNEKCSSIAVSGNFCSLAQAQIVIKDLETNERRNGEQWLTHWKLITEAALSREVHAQAA